MLRGENLSLILLELAPWERERIEALSAGVVETFSREQMTALMFLSSEVLEGIGLAERVEIWEHLRDNGGKISFDDLVEIGVYNGDELADGGFWRWLQGLDLGGGPANFAGMLEVEYELNSYGTSFAVLDAQQRRERGAQMVVMLAMMAGPVVGRLLTGPSGVVYGDGKLDTTESTGTAGVQSGSKVIPKIKYPGNNPKVSPGIGWEWRGPSDKGSWYNPKTGESLRPDLDHPQPIGPHWDYKDPNGIWYRLFPDGSIEPK